MILNIRGPSGAGKSWVVRQLLQHYNVFKEEYAADQRTVEGYWIDSEKPAFVVGSYTAPTGGADSLHDGWNQIADILLKNYPKGHVILEGIRINSGHSNLIELVKKHSLQLEVLFLNTTEEECFQNVVSRRKVVRNKRDIDQVRFWIRDHIKRNARQINHFNGAGIPIKQMIADEMVRYIIRNICT